MRLTPIELENIKRVIESVIFGKENDFDFEISTMEDLAMDRSVEFDAYNNSLSRINPYFRLGDIDDQKIYNAYNNFTYKIKELTKSQKKNKVLQEFDEYDINNYRQRLNNESNEPEYLVFEIQKRLTKK